MLRISIKQDGCDLSLVLEGRLVGPWVDELQKVCHERGAPSRETPLIVDLCGVTAMDTHGQALLDRLLQQGAVLRCSDVMNQYLVEQMARPAGSVREACRPCQADAPSSAEETALAS